MVSLVKQKVTSEHLQRKAYLYVRQSSLQQVRLNQESGRRQYALQQRAVELGWPKGRIVVVDGDQGHSGVSAADRKGFQQLVAEVGIGKAGIVLGLEVSRLARNNADWHHLLEICALTHTLILDEDGLYDPCDYNDRLLLGLKGTFSEAELHVLKARMRGGLLNKAQRGQLHLRLPVGFVYDSEGKIVFDPDKQVQQSLRLLFQTYRRVGTGRAVAVYFRQQNLLFPTRRCGLPTEKLEWKELYAARVVTILHNPLYAGAYVYGRSRTIKRVDGGYGRLVQSKEQWKVLIKDAHESYISWEEYEKNQKQLLSWVQTKDDLNKRQRPAREGCALLQGLAICGVCGRRMTLHYKYRKHDDRLVPKYECVREQGQWGTPRCQHLTGDGVDEAVGKLLMESVTPLTLEVALNVQKELQQRFEEADRIRRQQVERAQYEANLAHRRYMQVDPENRLVVGTLEAQWNEKLCALEKAKEEYERLCREDHVIMDKKKEKEILALATDFPRLWQNPNVSDKQRKRMVRLLIEDVTLLVGKDVTVHVRLKGGATKTLSVPKPKTGAEIKRTKPEVIKEIDHLLDHHPDREVAKILNDKGFRSSVDRLQFTAYMVVRLRHSHHIKSHCERLRERGMLTMPEMAQKLNISTCTLETWCKKGLIKRYACNKNKYLFEPPPDKDYEKGKPYKLRTCFNENSEQFNKEVQYE